MPDHGHRLEVSARIAGCQLESVPAPGLRPKVFWPQGRALVKPTRSARRRSCRARSCAASLSWRMGVHQDGLVQYVDCRSSKMELDHGAAA